MNEQSEAARMNGTGQSACSAVRYDIAWKDHKLERGPVSAQDAANIVVTHLRNWPDDPIWLTPNAGSHRQEEG